MANEEHLGLIKQGVDVWNKWREEHADKRPDLTEAELVGANLLILCGASVRTFLRNTTVGRSESRRVSDQDRLRYHDTRMIGSCFAVWCARLQLEAYLSLNSMLQDKVNIRHKTGLFLMILCFCLFACGRKSAHLKWEDTSDNEEGFRIYRITAKDAPRIAEVGPNVTTYIEKDALSGTYYAVSAFNSAGESPPSNTACLSH